METDAITAGSRRRPRRQARDRARHIDVKELKRALHALGSEMGAGEAVDRAFDAEDLAQCARVNDLSHSEVLGIEAVVVMHGQHRAGWPGGADHLSPPQVRQEARDARPSILAGTCRMVGSRLSDICRSTQSMNHNHPISCLSSHTPKGNCCRSRSAGM